MAPMAVTAKIRNDSENLMMIDEYDDNEVVRLLLAGCFCQPTKRIYEEKATMPTEYKEKATMTAVTAFVFASTLVCVHGVGQDMDS